MTYIIIHFHARHTINKLVISYIRSTIRSKYDPRVQGCNLLNKSYCYSLSIRNLTGHNYLCVSDENVHYILPLAHEYQTEALLSEIDSLLALISVQDEHKMSPSDVIDNIVEAEMYGLKRYLDINIDIASKERYIPALLESGFKFISNHSKSIMSKKHWDYKDKTYHKLHLISV